MPKYQTTWPRVLFGICAGGITGATIIVAIVLYLYLGSTDTLQFGHYGFWDLLRSFGIASAFWMIGILLFGSVPWLILHRLNFRSWPAAVALGYLLTFSLLLLFMKYAPEIWGRSDRSFYAEDSVDDPWISSDIIPSAWQQELLNALQFGVIGAVIGLAVWRTAYRRDNSQTTDHTRL